MYAYETLPVVPVYQAGAHRMQVQFAAVSTCTCFLGDAPKPVEPNLGRIRIEPMVQDGTAR